MNNRQSAQFRKLIYDSREKSRITNIIETELKDRHISYEKKVELLFAFSRLENISDKESVRKSIHECNIKWITWLIDKSVVRELLKYIKVYGKDITTKAILKAIEDNKWKTPNGMQWLDHCPSNINVYDGLDIIDEYAKPMKEAREQEANEIFGIKQPTVKELVVIEEQGVIVQQEEIIEPKQIENKMEENKTTNAVPKDTADLAILLYEEAREKMLGHIKQDLKDMNEAFSSMKDYISQDNISQQYEERIDKQDVRIKELENKCDDLEKKNRKLQDQYNTQVLLTESANKKSGNRKATIELQSKELEKKGNRIVELQSEIDSLNEELKNKKKSTKIIKLSSITGIYGVGKGLLPGIVDMLEKNGIVIDKNK